MFEKSFYNNKKKFLYFSIIVFSFYILSPYFAYLYGNYFFENVLLNFPVNSHDTSRKYVLKILNQTNFHYIFIINFSLFIIILFFFYKMLHNKRLKENYILDHFEKEKLIQIFQILILICIFFLIKDFYQLYIYITSENRLFTGAPSHTVLDHRAFVYRFIDGRIQTHYVIGAIFSIYSIKNKNYYFSIPCLVGIIALETLTFSRFYIFLICVSFLVLSKKKFAYIIVSTIFILIFYRLIIYSSLASVLDNLLWEPISLWCTEIVKFQNSLLEIKQSNFFQKLLFNNLSTNFIFFDFNNSYYLFSENKYKQFGSYANFGLIDIIAYPLQTLILIISILLLKKIINKYFYLNNLFLVLSIFSFFKILRGSSMDGLSFILKFEILLILAIIFYFLLKKLNFFKSSS